MDDKKRSKILVAGIIAIIMVGVGIWVYLEFTADIIVDREQAKKFGAVYEKDCQSRFEPDICKRIAARTHVTCFKRSVKPAAGDGIDYDLDVYLGCLQESEATFLME